jgi:glutamate-1-semialdehyde 2,1-aminomutase
MTGHAPKEFVKDMTDQLKKGNTFMLPTENANKVAQELKKRFGLPYWQMAVSATGNFNFLIFRRK